MVYRSQILESCPASAKNSEKIMSSRENCLEFVVSGELHTAALVVARLVRGVILLASILVGVHFWKMQFIYLEYGSWSNDAGHCPFKYV
jgi:hypothetical protein